MSVGSREHVQLDQKFQRLSLATDNKLYETINLILSRIANVSHYDKIIESEQKADEEDLNKASGILVGNVKIPHDIWIRGDITIKDIKLKTSILIEINNMIQQDIEDENRDEADVKTMSYYIKILAAYKLLIMPSKLSPNGQLVGNDFTLREEEDEGEEDGEEADSSMEDGQSLERYRTDDYKSFISGGSPTLNGIALSSALITSKSRTSGIRSPFSRDSYTRKRLLSILNHNESSKFEQVSPTPNEFDDKKQVFNSLFAKSRIYNKIKRHRELSSSMISNISNQSGYSQRDSISTASTNTSRSRNRIGSNVYPTESSDLKLSSMQVNAILPLYNYNEKQENQKNKYEYYGQLVRLSSLVQLIVQERGKSLMAKQLLEFIKSNVIKMIVVDIYQMITDYGLTEAFNLAKV
ncbi:uncharacterized protein PRCAT00003705001 [Priceomyces carsonii]|uniref:uncharacterized protein n=1 Tax=Priceomyces carsonii TaxID=28549 RepID=UPI002ED9EB34|nr:unnamed protein product [Priceomyces carsonii]